MEKEKNNRKNSMSLLWKDNGHIKWKKVAFRKLQTKTTTFICTTNHWRMKHSKHPVLNVLQTHYLLYNPSKGREPDVIYILVAGSRNLILK